jgi:hypothetical protein
MSKNDDKLREQRNNMRYYNQLLNEERKKKISQKRKYRARGFSSQKVDFKDHLYIPENWEFMAYTFYIVVLPYIVGAIFLFFTIAGASFTNFKLLNTSSFLIVWAIGYEIVALVSLIWIMFLYLQYDGDE